MNRRQALSGLAAMALVPAAAQTAAKIFPRADVGIYPVRAGDYTLKIQSLWTGPQLLSYFYLEIEPVVYPRFRRTVKDVLLETRIYHPDDLESVHNGPDLQSTYGMEDQFLLRIWVHDRGVNHRVKSAFIILIDYEPIAGAAACMNLSGVSPQSRVSLMLASGALGFYDQA